MWRLIAWRYLYDEKRLDDYRVIYDRLVTYSQRQNLLSCRELVEEMLDDNFACGTTSKKEGGKNVQRRSSLSVISISST